MYSKIHSFNKSYITYRNFLIILFLSIPIKTIFVYLYGDTGLTDEWQTIVRSLITDKTLSYLTISDQAIPTYYMPPLYSYYLYVFYLIGLDEINTIFLILISQIILSTFTTAIFLNTSKIFFNEKLSIIISFIFLIYPLNFFCSSQISSITLQIFLFCSFIYLFFLFEAKNNYIYFGFVAGLSMLIRGEFYLLFFLCMIFLLFNAKGKSKDIKRVILCFLISVILISPYLVRNYINFGDITITKSFGFNLWRGNNIHADVNGTTFTDNNYKNMVEEKKLILLNLKKTNNLNKYEKYYDDYLKQRALKNIYNNPEWYLFLYIKKTFYFLFFNFESNYPHYFNPLILISEIIISIMSLIGILFNIFSKEKNLKLLLIFLFYFSVIPIFFILPRYKLFILPLMTIYIGYFLNYIYLKRIFSSQQ